MDVTDHVPSKRRRTAAILVPGCPLRGSPLVLMSRPRSNRCSP